MDEAPDLRAWVLALRAEGRTRQQIRTELQISQWRLTQLLDGAAVKQDLRARAKDDLRRQARELRAEGVAVPVIADRLGVARSTASLWVRDLAQAPFNRQDHMQRMSQKGAALSRRHAAAQRHQDKLTAGLQIGKTTERELLLVGAALYWAEGSKDKSYARRESVVLVNSDPRLVLLFMRWLELVGCSTDDVVLRVNIHESADVPAAERYWADLLQIPVEKFARATLKRHNANPGRYNTRTDYHGCLVIRVRRSSRLYRQIEGWWYGLVLGSGALAPRQPA